MPIIRVNKLTDGLNELANPENLPDGGLQESSNYEMLGDGWLTKRKDPAEYGDHVSGDSLKTVLGAIFTSSILQVSPPYYPVKKLSDMTGDFLILLFGVVASGDYELYMTYENDSNTWTATKVDITGIAYDSNTYLEFFVGDDKLIITDTYNETTNFPHYVKIDAEGELITGLFSIKSPTNKPTLLPTTEYNAEQFEEDVDSVRLDDCGIVQCVYTVITKDGDESNPSPISNSRMMQFFKKDLTDKNDIRWIDYFNITNLSVPLLTGDLLEQLKYFNIYFRVIKYSEGEAAEPFYFSQRVEIVDKVSNEGSTGNGYLVNVPQDDSILLSHENDIAPYAKHAAEVSSITGFANIREKTRFPFDFEKYSTIEINNVNNKNFVDAVVKIRLYDKNNTETLDYYDVPVDFMEDLDLSYYNVSGTDLMTNLNLIRIYDSDLITPIKVMYEKYNGAPYLDIFVKVPLLVAGQIKFLYLCFNTSTGTDVGVDNSEYQTAEYGEFKLITDSSLFDTERVKSNKSVICSPMDYQDKNSEIINLADDNNPGEILGDKGSFDDAGTKMLSTQNPIGSGSYLLKGSDLLGVDFSEIKYSVLPFGEIPNKVTMWGRLDYTNINKAFSGLQLPTPIFALYQSTDHADSNDYKGLLLGIVKKSEDYFWCLYGANDMSGISGVGFAKYSKLIFNEIPITNVASGEVSVCLSIDKGESASLFIGNLLTGSFYRQKVAWESWVLASTLDDLDGVDWYYTNIDTFSIGFNNLFSVIPETFAFKISQFQLTINKYYSAENDNDITAIYNIANFMPSFETALGTKIITG